MKQNTDIFLRNAMTFGLYAVGGVFVLSLLSGLLQVDLSLLLLVVMGFVTYASNKKLCRKTGEMTFLRAFLNGLATHFFASLVLFFLIYIMLKLVLPEAVEQITDQMETLLEEQGQMNEQNREALKALSSPLGFALYMAFIYNLFAAAVSLALAFVKPRSNTVVKTPDQNETEE
jgi:hypothetical protein